MTELPTTNPPWGTPPPARLPILDTAKLAYGTLWAQRDDLLRLAVVPLILLLGFNLLLFGAFDVPVAAAPTEPPKLDPWAIAVMLLAWIPVTLFSANWLRVLLLGGEAVAGLGMRWGMRETKFLLRIFLVVLIAMLGALIMVLPLALITVGVAIVVNMMGASEVGPGSQSSLDAISLVPLLVAMFVIAAEFYIGIRLSLAFPATALDRGRAIRLSWAMTRGAGLRLHAAFLLVAVPFYAAAFGVQMLLGLAGLHVLAPMSMTIVAVSLNLVAMAASFSVLAIVYRRQGGPLSSGD